MPLLDLAGRFASGTSMHGIPKAIRARSAVGRIFWSLICLAAASMFTLQFVQLLTKYYSYPKKVTIEVVPSPVPFPSISLCNMRNLDTMVLNTLNHIFKETQNPLDWSNYTREPFIDQYMKTVAKFHPMFSRKGSDLKVFQTVLTRTLIATNVDRDLVVSAGIPQKEFVVTCRFGRHECSPQEFTQFFDPYYYNCFTYKAPKPDTSDSILAEGLENGWSTVVLTGSGMLDKNEKVRMIPGTHEYSSPMASSEGVRVVIHPPNSEPYPHTEGFDVPPGYSVSFGVKTRQNIRIGPPHGNCSDDNPFGADSYDYRLISCQKKCLQRAIVQECNCKDISLPEHSSFPSVPFCTNADDVPEKCRYSVQDECYQGLSTIYNRITCMRNTTRRVTRSARATRDCGCFPPCHERTHDVTYSISKWPAESFDGDEAYIDIFWTGEYPTRFTGENETAKYNLYGDYFDYRNRRRAMKDFSRLNVYIADSNVLQTEEAEDYSQSQLLSDIGGQLGLWVGISVITLAEVLELFVDICRYLGQRYRPGGVAKQEGVQRCQLSTCHCNGNDHIHTANANYPKLAGFSDPGNMV